MFQAVNLNNQMFGVAILIFYYRDIYRILQIDFIIEIVKKLFNFEKTFSKLYVSLLWNLWSFFSID